MYLYAVAANFQTITVVVQIAWPPKDLTSWGAEKWYRLNNIIAMHIYIASMIMQIFVRKVPIIMIITKKTLYSV